MSYNDDVFINMVNDNSNKKRILEEVRRKSIVTSETNYIKAKKNKNKKFKLKAISFLLVLGISLPTISFLVNKGFDNRDIYKETHNTASFVSSEMYRVNNNQDYAYDNYDIAKNVLDYNGNKDIHAVIYSCFSVYSYDVLKQMDELFSNMHSLINGH
ncbi:MAG: hypothetical protein RSG95_01695 [Bacilli bacterium]